MLPLSLSKHLLHPLDTFTQTYGAGHGAPGHKINMAPVLPMYCIIPLDVLEIRGQGLYSASELLLEWSSRNPASPSMFGQHSDSGAPNSSWGLPQAPFHWCLSSFCSGSPYTLGGLHATVCPAGRLMPTRSSHIFHFLGLAYALSALRCLSPSQARRNYGFLLCDLTNSVP